MIRDVVNAFLLVYAGLFPIVNPVGGAPLFLGATYHCTDNERHVLARQVGINSFFLLIGSLFLGAAVLQFFGISLPVVRIAGGLVVSAFGWTLLQNGGHLETGATEGAGSSGRMDGFYPLTMPLTVGPGSISVAITLGSQRPPAGHDYAALAVSALGAAVGLAAIGASVFVCYRFAERVNLVLGERGTTVMTQLSAFIMLCIGIQILWTGAHQLVHP